MTINVNCKADIEPFYEYIGKVGIMTVRLSTIDIGYTSVLIVSFYFVR